jgi:hypothetical protein
LDQRKKVVNFLLVLSKGELQMSLVLTGIVNGARPVAGTVQSGERQGEEWKFLSMEIVDPRYGKVYSCQLRDKDPQFNELVAGDKMKNDLAGHKVKVTVMGITAGEREIEDKNTGERKTIIQVRTQITNVRDLGLPDDDE